MRTSFVLILLPSLLFVGIVEAFPTTYNLRLWHRVSSRQQHFIGHTANSSSKRRNCRTFYMNNNNDSSDINEEEEEEEFTISTTTTTATTTTTTSEKDLLRPQVNIRKESILFSDNPATVENNNSLRVWKLCKKYLPFIFTGAREIDTADDNPIGGIYNMIFVRCPTILAGCFYIKNNIDGHPLIVDLGFGNGPFIVNPLVVFAVLFAILR